MVSFRLNSLGVPYSISGTFPILANVENVLLSEVVDGGVTKNDGIADYRAHCRNHLMDSSVFEQLFRLTLN